MKTTGKSGISGMIIKAIIITFIIFFIKQAYSQEITPEVITTQPRGTISGMLNEIDRFYEISERSLKIGYNTTLDTEAAFQVNIKQRNKYIIVNNFSENQVKLVFMGNGATLFNQPLRANNYVIFRIGDLNLKFTLYSADKTHAKVGLELFEEEIPENVDYFELFDIKVRLTENTIYSPIDLSAIIEFTNFGEGPSHVRLIYSIINSDGEEVFTGIDEKVVETNEVVVKKFDTLNIPYGSYTIKTTIHYGKDQEATSEELFTLEEVPKTKLLKQPLLFIGIILLSFFAVLFLKNRKKGTTYTN